MAVSTVKVLAALALLASFAQATAAALVDAQQPILLDAQSTEVDLRTNSARFLVALDKELCALVARLAKFHPENPNLQLDYSLKACIMENYKEQVLNSWDTVSCVSSCVAFGKHKIPYTQVEGGVVPTLKHKFFETDLTHGLTTWKDMALMCGMETPVIDLIIRWNQRLNQKEYLTLDGILNGKDIDECVIPSRLGVTLELLNVGKRD